MDLLGGARKVPLAGAASAARITINTEVNIAGRIFRMILDVAWQ